jgi:endonuclease-3 related protein
MLKEKLLNIYHRLLERYGPQHWWPGEGPFEVMVGAVLTQSAAWTNVEKAIRNLREAGVLSPEALRQLPVSELAALIFPSGYYNAKALKLKALADYLGKYQDDLERLFAVDTCQLRRELLGVHGIGEETADSVLLYAADRPVFVVDAYTRRIFGRVGLAPEKGSYTDYQGLFTESLPADAGLFNEYHALLVCLGKNVCRRRPLCQQCCLNSDFCRFSEAS